LIDVYQGVGDGVGIERDGVARLYIIPKISYVLSYCLTKFESTNKNTKKEQNLNLKFWTTK
jgi:hypothetical protein